VFPLANRSGKRSELPGELVAFGMNDAVRALNYVCLCKYLPSAKHFVLLSALPGGIESFFHH
jgi:hypothetical protein